MPRYPHSAWEDQHVPELRVRSLNDAEIRDGGDYVLYWMVAYRRTGWNYALQRAVEWATDLGKPLVILEALRVGYRWASDRLHYFVVQGMADNQAALADRPVAYYPYLEREPGEGSGLLEALAERAAIVVTDDFPCFFLPRMQSVAARRLAIRLETVDSNGLLPMRAAEKVYARAVDLRRFLQKQLSQHLKSLPEPDPLQQARLADLPALPRKITGRWPRADVARLARDPASLSHFAIDHSVPIVRGTRGGQVAAQECLKHFLEHKLPRYGDDRNQPDLQGASGFSPYLHFGHLSVHQVFAKLAEGAGWTPDDVAEKAKGSRSGWWKLDESTESFLDEIVTWRELGFNMCSQRADYSRYSSLPDWAQKSIAEHAEDPREATYTLEEFEQAQTHDEIWNAAQRQLLVEGRIHNYLRMLWGKKIFEWSATPQEAVRVMIELNNKYALDGRNPNSYSGIFWTLGRYDRAWGPERPVYGKIRYMSSDNTARKLKLKEYLARYSAECLSVR